MKVPYIEQRIKWFKRKYHRHPYTPHGAVSDMWGPRRHIHTTNDIIGWNDVLNALQDTKHKLS